MSAPDFSIELVEIALHGVSREIAETALSGLEGELARRIDAQGLRLDALCDSADVALGPLTVQAGIDAAGLRALLADALLGHFSQENPQSEEEEDA